MAIVLIPTAAVVALEEATTHVGVGGGDGWAMCQDYAMRVLSPCVCRHVPSSEMRMGRYFSYWLRPKGCATPLWGCMAFAAILVHTLLVLGLSPPRCLGAKKLVLEAVS